MEERYEDDDNNYAYWNCTVGGTRHALVSFFGKMGVPDKSSVVFELRSL